MTVQMPEKIYYDLCDYAKKLEKQNEELIRLALHEYNQCKISSEIGIITIRIKESIEQITEKSIKELLKEYEL